MNIHASGCEPVYVLETLNHKTLPVPIAIGTGQAVRKQGAVCDSSRRNPYCILDFLFG